MSVHHNFSFFSFCFLLLIPLAHSFRQLTTIAFRFLFTFSFFLFWEFLSERHPVLFLFAHAMGRAKVGEKWLKWNKSLSIWINLLSFVTLTHNFVGLFSLTSHDARHPIVFRRVQLKNKRKWETVIVVKPPSAAIAQGWMMSGSAFWANFRTEQKKENEKGNLKKIIMIIGAWRWIPLWYYWVWENRGRSKCRPSEICWFLVKYCAFLLASYFVVAAALFQPTHDRFEYCVNVRCTEQRIHVWNWRQ